MIHLAYVELLPQPNIIIKTCLVLIYSHKNPTICVYSTLKSAFL